MISTCFGSALGLLLLLCSVGRFSAASSSLWDLPEGQRVGHHARTAQRTCVPVPADMDLCRGIEWTQMVLPNLAGQETVFEAVQQSSHWKSLVKINCHPQTKQFLCSMYAPICVTHAPDMVVMPCRQFCQSVRQACEPRMRAYNFTWPDFLDCQKFDEDGGSSVCVPMDTRKTTQPPADQKTCKECQEPTEFEVAMDLYCQADVVVRAKILDKVSNQVGNNIVLAKSSLIFVKAPEQVRGRANAEALTMGVSRGKCHCEAASMDGSPRLIFAKLLPNQQIQALLISNWRSRSKAMKKALKIGKRGTHCANLAQIIAAEQDLNSRRKRKIKSPNRRPAP